MKSVTLKQIGYRFSGTALLNLWGGGQGEVEMKPWVVKGDFDRQKMIEGINDNGFGCEGYESVVIMSEYLYEGGYTEHHEVIDIDTIP